MILVRTSCVCAVVKPAFEEPSVKLTRAKYKSCVVHATILIVRKRQHTSQ